ncbi:MAG: small multi-drug export protein [Erysipelotrichaceae bacterium]
MIDSFVTWLATTLGSFFSKEMTVFIISLFPILELRGGILAGYFFGLPIWTTTLLAVVGNLLPIPFLLMFIEAIFAWCLKHNLLVKFIGGLRRRAQSKSESVKKYEFWGLCLFVAIPLPGTGAWTGVLVAEALGMERKRAMLSITLGVLIAGIVMLMVSYGLLNFIGL